MKRRTHAFSESSSAPPDDHQLCPRKPVEDSSTGVIILPTQTMHHYKEIPQIYHRFVLFDPLKMGNLMNPVQRQFPGMSLTP